jgi:hypothetical protein
MKHNPRLNEKVARMKGFIDVHPLQPQETVQGALQVINELAFWLIDADRNARRCHVAQGGRAWRIVRHPCHQAPRLMRAAKTARSSSSLKARMAPIRQLLLCGLQRREYPRNPRRPRRCCGI